MPERLPTAFQVRSVYDSNIQASGTPSVTSTSTFFSRVVGVFATLKVLAVNGSLTWQ